MFCWFCHTTIQINNNHRSRTKNFTICVKTQKTLNSQSNLDKEKQSWWDQPS